MLIICLLLFAGVAAGGIAMVYKRSHGGISTFIRRGHALTAVVGLVLLLYAALNGAGQAAWVALIILASGLAGGLLLFGVIFKGKRTPSVMIAAHASLGVTGLLVLAYAALA